VSDLVYGDILNVLNQLRKEREIKGGMAIVEVLRRAKSLMDEQNMPNNDGALTTPEIMDITGLSDYRISKDKKACLRRGEIEWTYTSRTYYGIKKTGILAFRIPLLVEDKGNT
jgi:hypothetical protein